MQDEWFERQFAESMAKMHAAKTPQLSIMATKGTLDWAYPTLVATALMRQTVRSHGIASVPDLREACVDEGVKFIACQMTVDLFGRAKADFVPGVTERAGAATHVSFANDAEASCGGSGAPCPCLSYPCCYGV